jgi:hypothetical protein
VEGVPRIILELTTKIDLNDERGYGALPHSGVTRRPVIRGNGGVSPPRFSKIGTKIFRCSKLELKAFVQSHILSLFIRRPSA